MIHGTSAPHTCAWLSSFPAADLTGGMVPAESSWLRSAGESHNSDGCHTFRKPMRQAMEISEAPMSTIHGLMKFEMRNCGTAKLTPHTRMAGQIWSMPRQPANAQIS